MTEEIPDAAHDATTTPATASEPVRSDAASPEPFANAADALAASTAAADALRGPEAADALRGGPEAPDYKDRWLRAEAELQNTRRRSARDREESVRASEDRILLDLIEVLDDLERALEALPPSQPAEAWTQGVTLTAQRIRDALARRGVTLLKTVGQPFDPMFHEALLEVPPQEGMAPGAVAQEVQRGYRRGDRALRAARVVVTRVDA